MIRRLAVCCLLLAALFSPNVCAAPAGLQEVVSAMQVPGVEVKVTLADCGTVNALYLPKPSVYFFGDRFLVSEGREVVLCNELVRHVGYQAGVVRFILAHEIAHAIIEQLELPYTGSAEEAADELAAVMLLAHGYKYDVRSAALFWPWPDHEDRPNDPHFSAARRRRAFECFADQFDNVWSRDCPVNLYRAYIAWNKLLAIGVALKQ